MIHIVSTSYNLEYTNYTDISLATPETINFICDSINFNTHLDLTLYNLAKQYNMTQYKCGDSHK